LVRVVSAAGSHCDERRLRQLRAQPPGEPLKALIGAVFVQPGHNGLGFTHDRVMEAAYALTHEHERASLHARIALAMRQAW
ncbi:hypothetical protein, partial [Bacillus sp. SIMBA_005]|uniref:hypothetical protein n=1 Tax=Bacillus sp. SIMBA_005 TaxID=3085754 RepID=UPI00397E8996